MCGIGNTVKAAKPGMNRGKSDHKACMQYVRNQYSLGKMNGGWTA